MGGEWSGVEWKEERGAGKRVVRRRRGGGDGGDKFVVFVGVERDGTNS